MLLTTLYLFYIQR